MNYIAFQLVAAGTPVSFLYPASWEASELQESDYAEVFLAAPHESDTPYLTSMVARMSPKPQLTLDEAESALRTEYQAPLRAEQIGRGVISVADCPAVQLELSYSIPLPLVSLDARPIAIRESRVLLKRGDHLCELFYSAPEKLFPMWEPAFCRLLESFSFSIVWHP